MGSTLFTSSCFSLRGLLHTRASGRSCFCRAATQRGECSTHEVVGDGEKGNCGVSFSGRREVLVSGLFLASGLVLGFPGTGLAVKQGLLAGRIPGLSDPDDKGWRTYRRPDDKSGGHGVGWSPIIPYTFKVPSGWDEVPVSIADLGGTEIDLRFASSKEGRLFVIVAPVLRFAAVSLPSSATLVLRDVQAAAAIDPIRVPSLEAGPVPTEPVTLCPSYIW